MLNYESVLVLILVLFFTFDMIDANALDCSPEFSRLNYEDKNFPFDLQREVHMYNRTDLDITNITYLSDGKTLNATIWLKESPRNNSTGWLNFGIGMDSDDSLRTGDVGTEFGYYYEYIGDEFFLKENEQLNVWYFVETEFSRIDRESVIQRNPLDYSDFSDAGKIFVSVDLMEAGNCPEKYKIKFFATEHDNNKRYEITDSTGWIEIPTPYFNLELNPSSINLVPGEEGAVQIKLKSTSSFDHTVNFTINDQLNQTSEELEIKVDPNEQIVPANSYKEAASIIATALDTATPKTEPYVIDVTAYIPKPITDDIEIYKMQNNLSLDTAPIFPEEKITISNVFSVSVVDFWHKYWFTFFFVGLIVTAGFIVYRIITKKRDMTPPQIEESESI